MTTTYLFALRLRKEQGWTVWNCVGYACLCIGLRLEEVKPPPRESLSTGGTECHVHLSFSLVSCSHVFSSALRDSPWEVCGVVCQVCQVSAVEPSIYGCCIVDKLNCLKSIERGN